MSTKNLKQAFEKSSADFEYLRTRIAGQIEFAEKICEFHPKNAAEWKNIITKAAKCIESSLESGAVEKLSAAVSEAEQILSPIAKFAKGYTIYCVGHAHIDMNWMWSWPETVTATNDTVLTVLKLMDEFPDFHFSQSQASIYAILEKHNPELLAKVAKRVKEGRWEVIASHWVEGDKNMAGGESQCRHLLYTRKYMQELFGLKPEDVEIDWSPDTFGHPLTVPSFLSRGGVKYLYLHRPGVPGHRPLAFWWKAKDGSKVLVKNDMMEGYNGMIFPQIMNPLIHFTRETKLPYVMYVYGVGDHGGGPTRADILRAMDLDKWPIFPRIKMTTAKDFYQRLEKDGKNLPTLDFELNYEVTGCYTTQTLIKKANRYAENRLADAETETALIHSGISHKYPSDEFTECWHDTLFNHFHDILPGSGVHDTRTYTHGLFQKTMASVLSIETNALRDLASKVNTVIHAEDKDVPASLSSSMGAGVGFNTGGLLICQSEQGGGTGPRPFLIFNPCSWERNEISEVTVWDNKCHKNSILVPRTDAEFGKLQFAVRDSKGKLSQAQVLCTGNYWGHSYARLAFPVSIPALGYNLYTIYEDEECAVKPANPAKQTGIDAVCPYLIYERGPEGLENDLIKVEIDTSSGGIKSLVDKKTGANLVGSSSAIIEYAVEKNHHMSAWLLDHIVHREIPQVVDIRRVLKGSFKSSIEVKMKVKESEITITYELCAGDPRLHMKVNYFWFQRGTPEAGIPSLRLAIPVKLENPKTVYEIPFGSLERDMKHGEEVPAINWAAVSGKTGGKKAGIVLSNDSKYGHSFNDGNLYVTIVRSSYQPDPLPESGPQDVAFTLTPFAGDLNVVDAIHAGKILNHPLKVVGTNLHSGDLPESLGIISVSPERAVLACVKKAEKEDALIIRLFNPTAVKCDTEIAFAKEFLGKLSSAVETDLLEMESRKLPVRGNKTVVGIVPFGIATVKVSF